MSSGAMMGGASAERVIVVGAGVAGLVLAHDLARGGVPVLVLEAAERIGGQLDAIEIGGVLVDAAAESYSVRSDAVAELAAELGLSTASPLDSPAWLIGADGRSAPLPAASVLGIPAYPFAADVSAVIGPAGSWRAQLDKVLPMLRPDKYASLGDLVRRRMGARVLDRLVAPVVRGVHSTSPDAVSLDMASPELRPALRRTGSLAAAVADVRAASPAGSQVGGIVGGMHLLVDRLADQGSAYGAEIRTGVTVAGVESDAVMTSDGERIAGRVVVAAPGIASSATRQREIVVALVAVESATLDAAPRGTGALVAAGAPGIAARAFTHASAKWAWLRAALDARRTQDPGADPGSHRHIVRLSYDAMPEDPEARVLADLRAIAGADDVRLEDLAVRRWVRTLAAEPVAAGGPLVVGEAASGTGLATIVPGARALAARIIDGSIDEGAS